ncbi:MAG: nitroreductase family protein, partial [Muribaculaceae bacterium]|nr:nitroreductase family protein [Muribaculaceae bacterium]
MKKILFTALISMLLLSTACSEKASDNDNQSNNTAAVIDNIMTRTSIRKFTNQPIGADTLTSLVKAGMAAPTAVNKQPWSFIVVTEREVLDSLMNVHPYSNLATATAAIVVCGEMEKALDGFGRDYWIQDCSAATENILLAAHAYGLGAVWCGVYPNPNVVPGVKRVLSIPGAVTPLSLITLGHPADNPAPKDKWNPENVH